MERLAKVATPLIAVALTVPPRGRPPGLAPTAMLIAALLLVTVLPPASWMATRTDGLMLTAAAELLGCVVNATLVAGPTPTAKLVLVAPVTVPREPDRSDPLPPLLLKK